MGLAIPSPFGFSSYSYSSGVRISWWEISLACPGCCTQTVIVFLGRCQEYKSLKLNSTALSSSLIIIIINYHYHRLSSHYIASLIMVPENLEAVGILYLYCSWYALEYNMLSVMAEVCPGMCQFSHAFWGFGAMGGVALFWA